MQHIPFWEADSHPASKKLFAAYGTQARLPIPEPTIAFNDFQMFFFAKKKCLKWEREIPLYIFDR
jgi:hypothetical protein